MFTRLFWIANAMLSVTSCAASVSTVGVREEGWPAHDSILERQARDRTTTVQAFGGGRYRAFDLTVGPDSMSWHSRDGTHFSLPLASVQRVEFKGDGHAARGAGQGFLIGTGLGAIALTSIGGLAAAPVYGGIPGAIIGLLVGGGKRDKLVYQRGELFRDRR